MDQIDIIYIYDDITSGPPILRAYTPYQVTTFLIWVIADPSVYCNAGYKSPLNKVSQIT